jgi:hypothetical protein
MELKEGDWLNRSSGQRVGVGAEPIREAEKA